MPELPQRKPNQLVQLLTMFPDKPWNWSTLSCNPNITMEWIMAHLDSSYAWEWVRVCENPNLTMQFFLETLLPKFEQEEKEERGQPRDRNSCLMKKRNEWTDVEECFWSLLSLNPGLKYAEIRAHYLSCTLSEQLRYKWHWNEMLSRSDVSVEMLLLMAANATDFDEPDSPRTFGAWNAEAASKNPNLTTDVVLNNLELWNFDEIAKNSAVKPTEELINRQRYNVDFVGDLSDHPLLSFQLVLDHCGEFSWWLLSSNPIVTLEMILTHSKSSDSQCAWKWSSISANPNLTVQHLQSPSVLPSGESWDKESISSNPSIPADFIINSKTAVDETKRFFVCEFLSDNPNLTAQLVEENVDQPWEWSAFSENKFAFHKNSLAEKEAKYHEAMDPAVWNLLLFDCSDHSDSSSVPSSSSRRFPTSIAKLTLQYFSPFY